LSAANDMMEIPMVAAPATTNYEECLACQ